jgi:hypothetical protein
MNDQSINRLSAADIDRIIEMAWEDRTPFEAIEYQFGIERIELQDVAKAYQRKKIKAQRPERFYGKQV